MNAVLTQIVRTSRTFLPSGEQIEATSYIDEACGSLLQRVIRDIRPQVGVEVGLAFGISTLYILEALNEVGGQKLIGMDPAQHDNYWRGGGLQNVQSSGYAHLYEFHETTSQQLLPELVGKKQKLDFGFIDGWHTFDHTLVDFFYIDQMLNAGGVIVFDDVAYPAIRRVCDFVLTNRAYEIYDSVKFAAVDGIRRWGKAKVGKVLDPLVRTDKTPQPEAKRTESQISDAYFLAIRKLADDARRWDHFIHF